MVQVVCLGDGEEDLLDAGKSDQPSKPPSAPGFEGFEHPAHRLAQIVERGGALCEGTQRIDQNDLPIYAGKMIAEERLNDLLFIAFEAAFKFAVKGAARRIRGRWQGRKAEHGRAFEITREQEPPRTTIGKTCRLQGE